MRPIPHAAGLYLGILQFVFTLGWTVYAIYLPRLAASVGIPGSAVIIIPDADQAIFTVNPNSPWGSPPTRSPACSGRLGHWVAGDYSGELRGVRRPCH